MARARVERVARSMDSYPFTDGNEMIGAGEARIPGAGPRPSFPFAPGGSAARARPSAPLSIIQGWKAARARRSPSPGAGDRHRSRPTAMARPYEEPPGAHEM